jgi:hypothetical protein
MKRDKIVLIIVLIAIAILGAIILTAMIFFVEYQIQEAFK